MSVRPLIVVVCTANICRSPMAHAIFVAELARRGLDGDVQSAGVIDMSGALAAASAQKVCALWGTPMPKLESVYIAALELTNVTRVFVMEPSHRERVCAMMQVDTQRVHLLSEFDPHRRGPAIEDPVGLPMYEFQDCYRRLLDCIGGYLDSTKDFE